MALVMDRREVEEEEYQEYPSMSQFSATFSRGANGAKGRIAAVLIDRDGLHGYNFHEVCDSESADLQSVGVQFCDRRGGLHIDVGDPAAARGGFLYISDFMMPSEYRVGGATEASTDVVRQFVNHPELSDRWSLAVYVPECDGWRDNRPGGHERGSAGHKAFIAQGCAADMRAFFRAEFVQATTLDNRIYLTSRRRHTRLSHEEALAIEVSRTAPLGGG